MSFSRRVIIVAAFAVVSFPVRSAVDQAPTAAAEMATDRKSYTGAGGASCPHPLFAGHLEYGAGVGPFKLAISDLDGVNGPDLAVAISASDRLRSRRSRVAVATWRRRITWPTEQP